MYNLVLQHIKALCWKYCRNIQAYNTSVVQRKFKHVFSDYAALNSTIAQQQSFVTLLCASYMFRPPHGNRNGDIQHYSLLIADSVNDMHMWIRNVFK